MADDEFTCDGCSRTFAARHALLTHQGRGCRSKRSYNWSASAVVPSPVESIVQAEPVEVQAGTYECQAPPPPGPPESPDELVQDSSIANLRDGLQAQFCASLSQLTENRRQLPGTQTLGQKVNAFLLGHLSGI